MADAKISALPAASTPLAGTEVLPIVQSGVTDKVSVANLTAGRAVSAASLTLTATPLAVASGGTGLASFTANGIVYASGTTTLASGSALTFNGTNLATTGSATAASFIPSGSTVPTNGMYLSAANTLAWSTNSTLRMTLNASGSLGIGTTSLTGYNVRMSKTLTGATGARAFTIDSVIQSDVTSSAYGFDSSLGTAAASFTLPTLYHFRANQGSIGAGSSITTQVGFIVESSLSGAANNYGFYGNLAAGTGRYNFYAGGTAPNYMAGRLGLGTTSLTAVAFYNQLSITGATSSYANLSDGTVQSDVTSTALGYATNIGTAAASFTLSELRHFSTTQATLGASSSVTTQIGYNAGASMVGATTNHGFYAANTAAITAGKTSYGFYSAINIATGGGTTWAAYMAGTAPSAFAGLTRFGAVTAPVNTVDITGSLGRGAPVTKTGDFTLGATENWVIVNQAGTTTVTLPAASSWTGREVMFKTIQNQTLVSASSNVVPLAGGAAGTAILAATAGKWATCVSDGTNWILMAGN